jgi:hypothetical protein
MSETIYLFCAIGGGTLMVCQFLASLLGMGGHHDTDAGGDHDMHHDGHAGDQDHTSWFVGVLTFRSLVAALTFFGLTGLTATNNVKMEPTGAFVLALAAGIGVLFLVAYLMQLLHRLKADGTARIERAVGQPGTVYLTIPGQKAGVGKVTLVLQNRTVEYQAVTPHAPLPTGAKVVVTAVLGPDTVEVEPAA